MELTCLHAFLWDRPNRIFPVNLLPLGKANLLGATSCQDEKEQSLFADRYRKRWEEQSASIGHVSPWNGWVMLDALGLGRLLGQERLNRQDWVCLNQTLRNTPHHDPVTSLSHPRCGLWL